ncbi:MAG TPA: DUF1329 domain-containing protein [Myxococcota bacterium]|jgi:hypothetical protein|nr:DUF1329 domain-containing protein [Myxococcota bacterium]
MTRARRCFVRTASYALVATALGAAGAASVARGAEEEPSAVGPRFKEGDVITNEKLDVLRPYLPPEFWSNRDFFFYPGMRLEIGPAFQDFSPAVAYQEATKRFAGKSRIGPDGSLEGYVAGQPFPMEQIDCKGDPEAGTKIMWDFDYQWEGDGTWDHFLYTYWDRGEQLPLFYEGTAKRIKLSGRVEKEELENNNGDLFRGEKRKHVFGIEVSAPFDARGTAVLTYRYKSSDGPRADAKNDDTWVYVPTLRRVRRISTAQRTDAVSGTDFTFDDLRSFDGIVPQYEWKCLGEMDLIAPTNSRVQAYPYEREHNFGPYGLSYADDRWELRKAVKVRMTPKNADHPYKYKDIYLDKQTLVALYSFAYDQKDELWKIIWHDNRWSEDDPAYYPGWPGVEKPRDLKVVSDIIVNVQTGTGNRIEFWDNKGTPFNTKGQVRRYIDVGRLTLGR